MSNLYVWVVLDESNYQTAVTCTTEEIAKAWCEYFMGVYNRLFTVHRDYVTSKAPDPDDDVRDLLEEST